MPVGLLVAVGVEVGVEVEVEVEVVGAQPLRRP
jgi:hypothetical protein